MSKNALYNSLIILISSFVGVILFLLLFEGVLTITDRGKPNPLFVSGDYGWSTWAGSDHLSNEPHSIQVNQFGFRGQPFNSESPTNIILLGDSQVETSHKLSEMPERYLSDALGKRIGSVPNVISIGSWGWGTDQQYLALKEHIDVIKPAYVVLWFTTNDYLDNARSMGFVGLKPTFWLTEGELQGPTHEFLEKLEAEDTLKSIRVLRRNGLWLQSLKSEEGFHNRRIKPNYAEQITHECSTKAKALGGFDLARYFVNETRNGKDYAYFHEMIYGEEGGLRLGTEAGIFGKYSNPRPNWLEYQKKLTQILLKKIKALVEGHGAKFVVLYAKLPNYLFSTPVTFCDDNRGEVSYDQIFLHDLIDETLQGIEHLYVDGLPMKYKDSFDGHLNNAANSHIMKKVAEFIVKELD